MHSVHFASQVCLGEAVGCGDQAVGAGIAKKVSVHTAQGFDVASAKRLDDRPQTCLPYLLPPSGWAARYRRRIFALRGLVVSRANSSQQFCIVAGIVEPMGKTIRDICEIVARIITKMMLAVIAESLDFDVESSQFPDG
jgi:hypothetical protein